MVSRTMATIKLHIMCTVYNKYNMYIYIIYLDQLGNVFFLGGFCF